MGRFRKLTGMAAIVALACAAAAGQERPKEPGGGGPPRTLADLLESADGGFVNRLHPEIPRRKLDEAAAAAEGIRKLTSKRLILYTDLPSSGPVDELRAVFDLAFPKWCDYFSIPPDRHADWSMTGFLMADRERFRRAGLVPEGLPDFKNGYTFNFEFWVADQPSDYYRRHLLLHEGTHGFMLTLLGGCGPPWYMEGLAEYLGTHRWAGGQLTLGVIPAGRDEVPHWGRTLIIQDAFAAQHALSLRTVMNFGSEAHQDVAAYAWSWGAVVLLEGDPRWRDRFRAMRKHVLSPRFQDEFDAVFRDDWPTMAEEWQVFVADLEYGYDVARTAIELTPGRPISLAGATVTVQADRGWQNSGVSLAPGEQVQLTARGRYQVADRPQIWWCEPNGVSIRYYRGQPLGLLLAAIRPDAPLKGMSALLRPTAVGLSSVVGTEAGGTLYFKINDSAGELADNAGELSVRVEAVAE